MMLHTKYQSSRPCGFREEDFLKFSSRKSIFSLCDLDMQWLLMLASTVKSLHAPGNFACHLLFADVFPELAI